MWNQHFLFERINIKCVLPWIFPSLIIIISMCIYIHSHSRAHFLFQFFIATCSRSTRRTSRLRNHSRRIYHVLSSLRAHRSRRLSCISTHRRPLVHATTLLTHTWWSLSSESEIIGASAQSCHSTIFMSMVPKMVVQFCILRLTSTCRLVILIQQHSCLFRNELVWKQVAAWMSRRRILGTQIVHKIGRICIHQQLVRIAGWQVVQLLTLWRLILAKWISLVHFWGLSTLTQLGSVSATDVSSCARCVVRIQTVMDCTLRSTTPMICSVPAYNSSRTLFKPCRSGLGSTRNRASLV